MRASARFAGAIVGLVLAFGALPASAALITGDLSFSGDFETSGSLGSATALTFPGNDFDVDGSNGDFSSIAQGDIGNISDFDLTGPLLFDIAGFSFDFSNLSVVAQNDNFLLISGTGTVAAAGFDTTAAEITFSANVAGPLKNFSATVTAVPVPGALILFASALGVLGLRRR